MRTAACLSILAALGGLAHADHRRYSRAPAAQPDVKLSPRVKPVATAARPAQPEVTGAQILEIEERAQPIRGEQESLLLQLVRDTPDTDPDKPEYLFRLAEHYARQHQLWRLISVRRAME